MTNQSPDKGFYIALGTDGEIGSGYAFYTSLKEIANAIAGGHINPIGVIKVHPESNPVKLIRAVTISAMYKWASNMSDEELENNPTPPGCITKHLPDWERYIEDEIQGRKDETGHKKWLRSPEKTGRI